MILWRCFGVNITNNVTDSMHFNKVNAAVNRNHNYVPFCHKRTFSHNRIFFYMGSATLC